MRVYIACLAAYNAGKLHGQWFDLIDAATFHADVATILKSSPEPDAEEWAIHDYEGVPGSLSRSLGENPSPERLEALVDAWDAVLERFPDEEKAEAALEVFTDHKGLDAWDDLTDWLNDAPAGEGDTLEAWCEEFLEDTGGLEAIPENLRTYFDFERYARDLKLGGDITATYAGGALMVFWANT